MSPRKSQGSWPGGRIPDKTGLPTCWPTHCGPKIASSQACISSTLVCARSCYLKFPHLEQWPGRCCGRRGSLFAPGEAASSRRGQVAPMVCVYGAQTFQSSSYFILVSVSWGRFNMLPTFHRQGSWLWSALSPCLLHFPDFSALL